MSDKEKKRSKKYNRTREKFDELPLEEKATFLVEAVFTTLTKGIEQAGKAFSDELNSLFDQARERAEQHAEESASEAGEAGEDEAGDTTDEAGDDQHDHSSDDDAGNESSEEKH
ncbi:MAG: hypothetical protein HKN37_16755 [Rhodothermales bacterium]|nr:hypothetical protein [Rhodothermales bacterium]